MCSSNSDTTKPVYSKREANIISQLKDYMRVIAMAESRPIFSFMTFMALFIYHSVKYANPVVMIIEMSLIILYVYFLEKMKVFLVVEYCKQIQDLMLKQEAYDALRKHETEKPEYFDKILLQCNRVIGTQFDVSQYKKKDP